MGMAQAYSVHFRYVTHTSFANTYDFPHTQTLLCTKLVHYSSPMLRKGSIPRYLGVHARLSDPNNRPHSVIGSGAATDYLSCSSLSPVDASLQLVEPCCDRGGSANTRGCSRRQIEQALDDPLAAGLVDSDTNPGACSCRCYHSFYHTTSGVMFTTIQNTRHDRSKR
ncbi:hypothetical protein BX600DRAFT_177877 [Xylariales sp. PMI_506]|nr:hypothetical protein BX600DRAFT_177877 [Xylariales sp. PMI_506]